MHLLVRTYTSFGDGKITVMNREFGKSNITFFSQGRDLEMLNSFNCSYVGTHLWKENCCLALRRAKQASQTFLAVKFHLSLTFIKKQRTKWNGDHRLPHIKWVKRMEYCCSLATIQMLLSLRGLTASRGIEPCHPIQMNPREANATRIQRHSQESWPHPTQSPTLTHSLII